MSTRLILRLVVVGIVLVVVWLLVWPRTDPRDGSASPLSDQGAGASAAMESKIESNSAPAIVANLSAGTNRPTGTPAETEHEAYVSERVTQLQELAMQDDSASLDTILSELNNRDPDIRKAARESAVQFGSRDAIPKLEDATLQTDDAHEKVALMDAIEFLKLPSLSEVAAQSSAPGNPERNRGGITAIRRKTVTQPPTPAPQQ